MNFFDGAIYNLLFKLHSMPTTFIMTFIAHLASWITLVLITVGILIFCKGKGNSRFIAFNLAFSYLLSQILKLIFRRPRPEVLRLAVEKGYSFPSGHAMVSCAFYGFFVYLILTKVKDKKKKKIFAGLLIALIFLIGISRIYLGVHYATDVIAGHIFAIIYLYFTIKYIYNSKDSKFRRLLLDKK